MRRALNLKLNTAGRDRRGEEQTPMSVYGANPDDVPAMAWMRRLSRSGSDEAEPETNDTVTAGAASSQGASTPQKPKSPRAIKVVSDTKVSYRGAVHRVPSYIVEVGETSSLERNEKCNSCDDLVKVLNSATKSWHLLRGDDVVNWERATSP
jgi:hypothetical protein